MGPGARRSPLWGKLRWEWWVAIALVIAGVVSLRTSSAAKPGQPPPVVATTTLRLGGVELDVLAAWAAEATGIGGTAESAEASDRENHARGTACPRRPTAYVGTLSGWTPSLRCPRHSDAIAVVLSRGDDPAAASLPLGTIRRVAERNVVVAVRGADPATTRRLLAGVRLLRVGDTVQGCPAAALTPLSGRDSFAGLQAQSAKVVGATVCSYTGVWLGAVRHLDRVQAGSLVKDVLGSRVPSAQKMASCDEAPLQSPQLHGWLVRVDLSGGAGTSSVPTTDLLALQRCAGDISNAEVIIADEPPRVASSTLWHRLTEVTADGGLTPG